MQKPIPFLAPVPAAIYIALNFRADLANKKGLSSRKGIRKYILQQYFKNRQVDCSFVECSVFLMLVVLPWLYIFLVICISYVISDLVISRSVLDVLCS